MTEVFKFMGGALQIECDGYVTRVHHGAQYFTVRADFTFKQVKTKALAINGLDGATTESVYKTLDYLYSI